VVQVPPNARAVGGSAFTPNGIIAYDDQSAISFQCHPEFDPAYAEALLRLRRGMRLSEQEADAAIATLHRPDDRARVGEWIRRFLAAPPS
jgi:GMP synthase-like glutamine amidotransferase